MRYAVRFLSFVFTLLAIFYGHVLCANILPFPFDKIDIIFISLWWGVLFKNSLRIWWLGLCLGFLTELYSSNPFGIGTMALLAGLTVGEWFTTRLFSGYSWYIIAIGTCVALTSYHVIFLLILSIHHSVYHVDWNINASFLVSLVIEIGVSTTVMTLSYIVGRIFLKDLKPHYIQRKFRV